MHEVCEEISGRALLLSATGLLFEKSWEIFSNKKARCMKEVFRRSSEGYTQWRMRSRMAFDSLSSRMNSMDECLR